MFGMYSHAFASASREMAICGIVIHDKGHRGHAAAARSSLSAPRMTILSASSGNGGCSLAGSSTRYATMVRDKSIPQIALATESNCLACDHNWLPLLAPSKPT